MLKSYKETVAYLYDNLPMFQRIGASAFKKDLSNTIKLCEALGNPQSKFKSIHIAGTNGKGSTSHMIASILQSSGYKTGLYTSPHLKEFTERIKVDGEEVSQLFVVDFVNRMQVVIEEVKPSFFEITVAMAFDYFAYKQVDVAVIEVGLGGRLDSTNIIKPELCLITNIGWDHKDLLGDTLEKIATEKAGIIKSFVPVVVSEKQDAIAKVFIENAKTVAAPLYFASDVFTVRPDQNSDNEFLLNVYKDSILLYKHLLLPLQGFYQRKNLSGVLQAMEILIEKGWKINYNTILTGLAKVITQTGLKGRWQKLGESPLMICDTGHNVDGVREVLHQIKAQSFKKLHIVWGCVKDKDVSEILMLLPTTACYYFCQAKIPRAMEADKLALLANTFNLQGEIIPDVNNAVQQAKLKAASNDMIFIGGSTFVVAEINNL